eukprot:3080417-Pyramimonas_sp.AAC.1
MPAPACKPKAPALRCGRARERASTSAAASACRPLAAAIAVSMSPSAPGAWISICLFLVGGLASTSEPS